MSQARTVTRLAVRELWISYRLLLVLVAFVGAGAAVALVPSPLAATAARLALGLLAATGVAAGVAAWSVSEERTRGRAAWLVTRAVPRGTLLGGWFAALAGLTLLGIGAGGVLGWLATSAVAPGLQPAAFAAPLVAIAAHALAGVALGTALGTVLPRRQAAPIAGLLCAVVALAGWLLPGLVGVLPGGAFALLGHLDDGGWSPAVALRSAGIGLALTALLLTVARAGLERAEL